MPTVKRAVENPFRPQEEGLAKSFFDLIFGSNPVEEMQRSLGPSLLGLGRGNLFKSEMSTRPNPMMTTEGVNSARDALMKKYDDILRELGTRYHPPGSQPRLPGM